ncbi:hypothetical protein [Rhodococcus gannanensis]|uniref:Uncharacterized protein n=1 Tax=Rhodococcus gannanensis TaxID=1960308 RepID=A0ABW4NYM5_9NOCA
MTENNALADLGIDLAAVLGDPDAAVNVSSESVTVGLDASTGTSFGAVVEVELSAPGGVPQVSVEGSGHAAIVGEADAGASYDAVDVTAGDGTVEATVESVDAAVAAEGGAAVAGGFDIDLYASPDGGLPVIDAGADVEFLGESELHVDGGYTHTEIDAGGYGDDLGM